MSASNNGGPPLLTYSGSHSWELKPPAVLEQAAQRCASAAPSASEGTRARRSWPREARPLQARVGRCIPARLSSMLQVTYPISCVVVFYLLKMTPVRIVTATQEPNRITKPCTTASGPLMVISQGTSFRTIIGNPIRPQRKKTIIISRPCKVVPR